MKQIEIYAATGDYKVWIGHGLRLQLDKFFSRDYSSIFIITDDQVAPLYLQDVLSGIKKIKTYQFIIPNGETSKSIDMFYRLQTEMIRQGFDRQSAIVALGGGVVGDLAGFVAATFMRGIDYYQVPTTILAHDSSVGGKVAINHELGKNMIGNFYHPKAVVYDVATLGSLPYSEIRSGYAELVKEAFIGNKEFLGQLLTLDLKALEPKELIGHLFEGIRIKAKIVEADEKEAGIRMFLNFGHTLAHAIETELGYGKVTHGEAVAIGILFALKLSEKYFNKKLHYGDILNWLHRNEYPVSLFQIGAETMLAHMKRDKKTTRQQLKLVLLREIGQPEIVKMTEADVIQALEGFQEGIE